MDPVEPGLACGSDTAHMSIFGYDPRVYYRGRGAFETMGAGLPMVAGDIAFKSNFACIDDATDIVVSRRADRSFEAEGPVLSAALDGAPIEGFPHHSVAVRYATEHRCAVRVRGPGLSDRITGTDPLKDGRRLLRCAARADIPHTPPQDAERAPGVRQSGNEDGTGLEQRGLEQQGLEQRGLEQQQRGSADAATTAVQHDGGDERARANQTAEIVEAVSRAFRGILANHAINVERAAAGKDVANVVLLRGCGVMLDVPPFHTVHNGVRGFVVAPTKIIAGLAMTLGLDVLEAPGATGDYHTDVASKLRTAAAGLAGGGDNEPKAEAGQQQPAPAASKYRFAFVHVKAVDDAGHDRDRALKVQWLERIDAALGETARLFPAGTRICVTGDHSTTVVTGDHSFEPVPFMVAPRDALVTRGQEQVVQGQVVQGQVVQGQGQVVQEELQCGGRRNSDQSGGDDATGGGANGAMGSRVGFSEIGCRGGPLGRFPGDQVMRTILFPKH
jgi:2,3-bisphosphoglycerate-independent phosphoglycerate mutase